jgi:glutaredoxin
MSSEPVKLFVSSGCGPCQEVRKAIDEGRFNLAKVDMIDITLPENAHYITEMGLNKVPAAFKNGKACKIMSDSESLMILCPGDSLAEESPAI